MDCLLDAGVLPLKLSGCHFSDVSQSFGAEFFPYHGKIPWIVVVCMKRVVSKSEYLSCNCKITALYAGRKGGGKVKCCALRAVLIGVGNDH